MKLEREIVLRETCDALRAACRHLATEPHFLNRRLRGALRLVEDVNVLALPVALRSPWHDMLQDMKDGSSAHEGGSSYLQSINFARMKRGAEALVALHEQIAAELTGEHEASGNPAIDATRKRMASPGSYPARMTTREVCELARIGPISLWRRIKEGTMPAPIDRGRQSLFDRDAVLKALGMVKDEAPITPAEPEPDWARGIAEANIRDRAMAESALLQARKICDPEMIRQAFIGSATLTRGKVAKLTEIPLEVLEHATRFRLIERSQIGGQARYTEAAVLAALGFSAGKTTAEC